MKVFDEGIWGGCLFIDKRADERAITIRAGCELDKPNGHVACVISLGCFECPFELTDGGEGFACGLGESGFCEELFGLLGFIPSVGCGCTDGVDAFWEAVVGVALGQADIVKHFDGSVFDVEMDDVSVWGDNGCDDRRCTKGIDEGLRRGAGVWRDCCG